MGQKTPVAFQDWKAGTGGYRNWRWINLLLCELPPPSLCWDRTVLLDALSLLKIKRGVLGLQALVSPFGSHRWVLYLSICGHSLVPSGLKGMGPNDACMGPGNACRMLASEAALLNCGCSPWSCRSGGRRSWWSERLEHSRSGDLPNAAGLMPALHLGLDADTWSGLT